MVNYYEILGLSYGAGIPEVKASFRHLAKLYHPDINPEGIEHFTKILKAYETLSDPTLKASYDYKLNYHQAHTQQQTKSTANTKNWRFDERELKRRQYYNDHIKKYAKQTSDYMEEAERKQRYNEFKYILFATPLAVVLFLLIVNLASRDRAEVVNSGLTLTRIAAEEPGSHVHRLLTTGDAVYKNTFGDPVYDSVSKKKLVIKNASDQETIVCLFSKKEFVRCVYLEDSASTELAQLPSVPLFVYYSRGANFDEALELSDLRIKGGFRENPAFYRSLNAKHYSKELTLPKELARGFEKTNENEFFKYARK